MKKHRPPDLRTVLSTAVDNWKRYDKFIGYHESTTDISTQYYANSLCCQDRLPSILLWANMGENFLEHQVRVQQKISREIQKEFS